MRIPIEAITDPKLAIAVFNAQRQIASAVISAQVRVDDGQLRKPQDDKFEEILADLKGEKYTPAPDEDDEIAAMLADFGSL